MIPNREITYENYLQTDHWKKKKEKALLYYGKKCVLCNKPVGLNVHHKSYENLFNERIPEDLVVLCKTCHNNFHDKKREFEISLMKDIRSLSQAYTDSVIREQVEKRREYYEQNKELIYQQVMFGEDKQRYEQIRECTRRILHSTERFLNSWEAK